MINKERMTEIAKNLMEYVEDIVGESNAHDIFEEVIGMSDAEIKQLSGEADTDEYGWDKYSFTAFKYDENGETEDFMTYDMMSSAILYARKTGCQEIVNDKTGAVVWTNPDYEP